MPTLAKSRYDSRSTRLPKLPAKSWHNYCCEEKSEENQFLTEKIDLPKIDLKGNMSDSDIRLIVYETLEQKRANKIGVKPLRNFNVTRKPQYGEAPVRSSFPELRSAQPLSETSDSIITGLSRTNTVAPFTTLSKKPTCGFYFSRDTINRKLRIGIPPSDLVLWRSDYSLATQQKQA